MIPEADVRDSVWRTWLFPSFGWLFLVLLFVALRWNSISTPLIRDEGEYAYAARCMRSGDAPYAQAFIQKPPMVVYSYVAAEFLFPGIYWGPRLLAAFSVFLSTVLLGQIARLELGRSAAFPVMYLATPMILLPEVGQFPANTEMFLLLPLTATLALYCRARKYGDRPAYSFVAGFLTATTLLYKYTALPVLAFVHIVWLIEVWRPAPHWSRLLRHLAAIAAGATLAAGSILGYFLFDDLGQKLWECTIAFNRYYVDAHQFGIEPFVQQIAALGADWWILFLVPWAGFLKRSPRRLFLGGFLLSALLATSASPYGHYYVVLMPALALLNATGIELLADRIAPWLKCPTAGIRGALVALVLLLLLRSDVPWITCSPAEFADRKLGEWSPFLESPAIARRIDELSAAEDPVFIAGSEPQILCYANRTSPTRFITMYSLMMPTPVAGRYQQEAIDDLRRRPPRLIVFANSPTSWSRQRGSPAAFDQFLGALLARDYSLVGGYVRDPRHGRWSETADPEELARTQLVLFERKN